MNILSDVCLKATGLLGLSQFPLAEVNQAGYLEPSHVQTERRTMKIGFTGTQDGMTSAQRTAFRDLIQELSPHEFHHGDCIGADADAHIIVMECRPNCEIHIHPPKDNSRRAFLRVGIIYPPKEYLTRNRDIVEQADILIATPQSNKEVLRSGTWSTVRKARIYGRRVIIIYPDGGTTDYKRVH